jgi:peptidoglycan hydrolase FlgJ
MTNSIKSIAMPTASTANANTYSDPNGLAALKKDPNSPQALRAVAQQVDALFMQMMLKSMRDASAASGESNSNEMSMYQDMFDKQIALTMSEHQGLGLGSLLTRQAGGASAAAAPTVTQATDSKSATRMAAPAPAAPAQNAADRAAPSSAAAPPTSMTQSESDFVGQVLPSIRVAAQALGVNPLALLAQAALETGWGKRMALTADGKPSLNLFGIKADESWAGARAVASTVEYSAGVASLQHTAFRAYPSVEDSVKDFAQLLKNSPRYRQALEAGGDAHGYAQSMGRAGYATDPHYSNKLSDILNSGALRAALSVRATKL